MRIDRLRQIREARGFSQSDLADRVGIHHQQIYRIETGQSDPSGTTLTNLAKALEVSVDYLVGLTDEPLIRIDEKGLTQMESRLVWAARNGLIVEALKVLTTMSETDDKAIIPTDKPAVNS